MYYDTHCHPYLAKEKSQDLILENFFSNGGIHLNTISTNLSDSKINIELSKKYPGVYASIGIHPTDTLEYRGNPADAINILEKMYHENFQKIVALGECGLDYYWIQNLSEKYGISQEEIKEIQKVFFKAQIHLAKKLSLPLIIHNRDAGVDVLHILKEEEFTNFVFHCFTENLDFAKKVLQFAPDCKLGFGGVTTFKSAIIVQEVVSSIPLKNIIIETDSPYLTPIPYRGKQENEPLYVKYVLDRIADLRSEGFEEIQKTILQNSIDFFITTDNGQ